MYFDYENEWKIKTYPNNDINLDDPNQIENELQLPPAPLPNATSQEAIECLNQEQFEQLFTIGSISI